MATSKPKKRSPQSAGDIFKPRIRKLQQRMAEWNVDALLISNPNDIRYLTGFVGDDSWAVVQTANPKVWIISDFRFAEQIKREAPQVKAVMRKLGLAETLKSVTDKLRIKRIAYQRDYITIAIRRSLVKNLGAKRITDVDDGLLKQRAIKDPSEIKAIRHSVKIQQQAYLSTLEYITPGMTEREVAGYLEFQMRTRGADAASFPSIVAVDANAALPHAIPGSKKVRKGGVILIDWGARAGGYCSDMTRVVAVGKMAPKLREIYQITLDAQLTAIAAVKPGVPMAEVDKIARDIIYKAGYGKYFGHGLGHGIGLDIHEQPVLSFRSKDILEPGHVVTVEPGIYLPGVGGVRIEDDVLVTKTGCQVLCNLPKSLDSAII